MVDCGEEFHRCVDECIETTDWGLEECAEVCTPDLEEEEVIE